jgi:uncharacterized RDD family membrane protein YckC
MADFPPPTDPTATAGGGPVFTLSPWSKRALAALIDYGIIFVVGIVFAILDAIANTSAFNYLWYLVSLGYWIWQWIRQGSSGQTIGKSAIGIKLVREQDASVVGPGLSIGRGVLRGIGFALCFIPGLVDVLFPLWDAKRQTVVDKMLNTVVIDV